MTDFYSMLGYELLSLAEDVQGNGHELVLRPGQLVQVQYASGTPVVTYYLCGEPITARALRHVAIDYRNRTRGVP